MDRALSLEIEALAKNRHLLTAQESRKSDIQKFFAGKTVLVTGATGFLGKQLTEKLLRSCGGIEKIYLLIRSKKGKGVEQRVKELIDDTVYDELRKQHPNFSEKLIGIDGDITELGVGLSDQDRNILINEVNVIFHGAATVRFDEPLKKTILTNVRGTREVFHLAGRCKNLHALVHISTAYSNCPRSEIKEDFYSSPVPSDLMIELVETTDEDVINRITPGLVGEWPNTYAYSKAIAEDVVKRLTIEYQLPVTVVRPAIVTAAFREPAPGWVDIANVYGPSGVLLGSGLGVMHSFLADPACNLDLVPVDFSNNIAIVAAADIAANPTQSPKVYNFTSTNENQLKWGKISEFRSHCSQLMSPKTLWYCHLTVQPKRYVHAILTLLWHMIPAYVLDFGSVLLGKKPRFRKIYTKMHKLIDVLAYFNLNEWLMHDANVQNLYKNLSDVDKELFNFDISVLDWTEFVQLWSLGIRKYIVKDGLKNTELGVRKQFWFRFGHYFVVFLYLVVIWKLISFVGYMFNAVVSVV